MLHILNGDSTANLLKKAELEGELLVWREALIAGPTPQGLKGEAWLNLRARHLAQAYDVPLEKCARGLEQQEEALGRCRDHEEVVLWFEHDLFCQTILIYLLDWFANHCLGSTRLSLISINSFPGKANFRGLGELAPDELVSLLGGRHEISEQEKTRGEQAWAAYCSPTPRAIERFMGTTSSALPFLPGAFEKHLLRFPSDHNGLGKIENTALKLIANGAADFVSLFTAFGSEEPLYGYGDLQFLGDLQRLGDAREPPLKIKPADETRLRTTALHKLNFEITEIGHKVARGESDFIVENEIDFWLGGVHLTNDDLWRWDGRRSIHTGA